ncbi:MAG: hypothetical protein HDR80_03180 [Bacteroides sp.]|nr:hypothetical protein [Bacteroides sp.]
MKKILSITAALFLMAPCALNGETVSQKQAKQMAQDFFNQAYGEVTPPVKLAYAGKRLTTDRLFTPFYVYNTSRGGFVIISAENKAYPILGYSLKSGFDADRLSEAEKGWLRGYAEDIEMIRYDPRVPAKAVAAWQNYPEYVASLLGGIYEATDPDMTYAEAYATLEPLLSTEAQDVDSYYSAYYTPDSWQQTVADNLVTDGRDGSVAVGYVDFRKRLFPGVAHGRKGDYFRIAFDRPNDWLLRLTAAEFMGERMVAALGRPGYVEPEEEEEPAFVYLEEVLAPTRSIAPSGAGAGEGLMAVDPLVRAIGSGHYDVVLPENAALAQVYNLSGSYVGRHTYAGQPVAHIDIEAEPSGFYFAIIYGESGRPYGVKLWR